MARDFGFAPTDKAPYYFISYNSQDAARVGAIAREMNRRGIPMWYDRGLLSGEEWEKQITIKIKNCYEMVMFVTKKLMNKENTFVRTEYQLAQKYNKKIHIVYLDKIDFDMVDIALQSWFLGLERKHSVQVFMLETAQEKVDAMDLYIKFTKIVKPITKPKQPVVKKQKSGTKPIKQKATSKTKTFFAKRGKILVTIAVAAVLIAVGVIAIPKIRARVDNTIYDDTSYYTYTIENGEVIITGLNNENLTKLKIPKKIEGKPVTAIDSRAFFNHKLLKSVILSKNITSIGDDAFARCTLLTSIDIPNSVTSIGNSAFYNCTSLTSIDIPNSVTSIGNSAFYNCTSLTSIDIPNSVTNIGNSAFYNCRKLVIQSSKGSYAETYAKENNIYFVAK